MKKIILCLIIVSCLLLSGCQSECDNVERMQIISHECNGRIVYDTWTGVTYWISNGYYNYGTLTLMVDADGKPLLYKESK